MDKRIVMLSLPVLSLFIIAFLLKGGLTGFAVFQGKSYVINLAVDSGNGVIPEDAIIVVLAGGYSKIFRPVEIVNASLLLRYRERGGHKPSDFLTTGIVPGTEYTARGYKGRFPFKIRIKPEELNASENGTVRVVLKIVYREKILSMNTRDVKIK